MSSHRLLIGAALLTLLSLLSHSAQGSVQLNPLDTVYLPAAKGRVPEFDQAAVEQIAYDPVKKHIYASGSHVFHVIDASDPNDLKTEYSKYEADMEFTDIEVCGDHVFMVVNNEKEHLKGVLRVYKSYVKDRTDPLELVREFVVGELPDSISVLKNCETVVISVEGEAYVENGNLVDPKGTVTIVHFPDGVHKAHEKATVTPLNFDSFNNKYEELKPSGVRFVYTENNNQFSNDLEPEFVAVDEHDHKAYVVLQENNAIAEVDLKGQTITNIHGLGYKQWGSLDASDRDGGIHISFWPIRAWYTPDAVKFHQWHGRKLLVTANEGDSKEYDQPAFDESTRGENIAASDLGPEIHEIVKSGINDEKRLGRLKFSKHDGKDATGKYSALYTYGGRSFSIWDVTHDQGETSRPLAQLYDSGSELEEMMALHCPHLFNREEVAVDDRSDDKGPEPESIALGEIDGRLYIFIGLERPGSIAVYSLGHDVSHARFETMFCAGIPKDSRSMRDLFAAREIYGGDPEDLRFYPAAKSPTGRPVLMVPGSVTGTVTLLDIRVHHDPNDQETGKGCPDSGVIKGASLLLLCICVLVNLW